MSAIGNSALSYEARDADVRDDIARHGRGWLMRRMLLVADVVALSGAFIAVDFAVGSRGGSGDMISLDSEFVLFFLTLPGWIVLAKLYGLYDLDEERADHSTADEILRVFHLVTVGAVVFYAASWLTRVVSPTPPKIVGFWLAAVVTLVCARALARVVARRQAAYVQRTVIVGADHVGQQIARKIHEHREYGMRIIGFVDAASECEAEDVGPLLGTPEQLPQLIAAHNINRVIMAFSNDGHERMLELTRTLADLDVCIDLVPRLFPLVNQNVGVHSIEGLSLVALPRLRIPRSSLLLKRAVDVFLALLALAILAPVLVIIALSIKLDCAGPALFKQLRMGAGDQPFWMIKFRTMRLDAEAMKNDLAPLNRHAREIGDPRLFKVADDPRVTKIGRFLRRYSLDELPQLINVVKGDMSLVGPRPLVLDEDRFVTDWRRRRLLVKPGMTGPWQVLGRDDLSFEEMVELDYRYVAGWSLLTDLSLLLRTLPAITRERTAY